MQYPSLFLAVLQATAAAAAAVVAAGTTQAPAATSGGVEGYGMQPMQWEIQAFPDGEFLTLEGTVQEVQAQLLALNPNWEADFPPSPAAAAADAARRLARRTDFGGAKTLCNLFDKASIYEIYGGIDYLRGRGGRPGAGPGPGNCGQVSCSWNSAIIWCNDDRSGKQLESFGSIADGAQHIIDQCRGGAPIWDGISGQVFHKTDWNVIVRKGNC